MATSDGPKHARRRLPKLQLFPPGRSETIGTATLAALLVLVGILVVTFGASTPKPLHKKAKKPQSNQLTFGGHNPSGPDCPLTGEPNAGGRPVPLRPALAVKVDNIVTARPQSGLRQADVVFEEPVEGGITRYVAVFECQTTPMVGPIRSARNIDIGILGQLGTPLLAHVGGIQPVLSNILASPIVDVDLIAGYTNVLIHPVTRTPPHDTFASTAALWATHPNTKTPPVPIFTYVKQPESGPGVSPAAVVTVPFSGNSNVVWNYDNTNRLYLRSYGTTPDILTNGQQDDAANVIVQFVPITYGPWIENTSGSLEVQANLYTNASGTVDVFRNGEEIKGHWSRDALNEPTQYVALTGKPIGMKPGRTWVELLPETIAVTTKP